MSLGWMNLQEYLAANQGAADDMSGRLDAQQAELDTQGQQAATKGDSLSYGQYLAKRRQMATMRGTDEGRAAMLGGEAGDAFLAGRGRSTYQPRTVGTLDEMQRASAERKKASDDYWAQQAERNRGLTVQAEAARQKQTDDVAKARRAMEERAGGPRYREYSDAVSKSYDNARGGMRRVSQEEWDRWTQ